MSTPHFYAAAVPDAYVAYEYNDIDDLKSLARHLSRVISPSAGDAGPPDLDAGEARVLVVPDLSASEAGGEGKFDRPAVTIELLDTLPAAGAGANAATFNVEHHLALTAYGRTRLETMQLAEKVYRAFAVGGRRQAVNRVPIWAFSFPLRLARKLRVVPDSFSMGMSSADDANRWSRPLEGFRMIAPRNRPIPAVPLIQSVHTSIHTSFEGANG